MSPVALNIFRSIPTNLELNGPSLSFTQDPVSASESITGVVTFTGICTAGFAAGMGQTADGTFTFKWYLDEEELFDTAVVGTSNASIVSTNGVQIGISTLTLTGMDYTQNGKAIYVTADYNPVGVGASLYLANTEPNAVNEPLRSAEAVLTTYPEMVISSQPTNQTVGTGADADFGVVASIVPDNNTDIEYQWQLNYIDLADGQIDGTQYVTSPVQATFTITDERDGSSVQVDWDTFSTYSGFVTNRIYSITTDRDFQAKIYAIGAKGGNSITRDVRGGEGGGSKGDFTFLAGTTYKLVIGGGGSYGNNFTDEAGYSGGGRGGSGYGRGGGGGGFTGLFAGSITQANAILIAGGGGGGSNDPAVGGPGGGQKLRPSTYANTGAQGGDGGTSGNPGRGGLGGTNLAGGTGGDTGHGTRGDAGAALLGGAGAAGGGGGYFGGGGGGQYSSGCCADGSGGGGSGFIHPTLISNGEWSTVNANDYYTNVPSSRAYDGSFKIDRVATVERITTTVSGSTTPNLTLNSSSASVGGPIRCKLTNTGSSPSVIYSDTVNYTIVNPRDLLKFEAYYGSLLSTATSELTDTNSYTLNQSNFGSDYSIIQFHAPEQSFELGMTLNASSGGSSGGEGGKSDITFTIAQNEEYTLIGISNNSAIYLYRGSTLIAAAGQGGQGGGDGSTGGRGGGVDVGGEVGRGRGGGQGGDRVNPGDLTLTGIWGSLAGATGAINSNLLQTGDTIATSINAGRTISCSKGAYWLSQQVGACAHNSTGGAGVKYRDPAGTEVSGSAVIIRGFKPGYTVTNTAGYRQQASCGNGGNGATGGQGGAGNAAGGGGSGYSNGSITVRRTQLGGNSSTSSSVVFYIPTNQSIVTWNVSRSAAYTNIIQFRRESGEGPDTIGWGPNTSTIQTEIAQGSVYVLDGIWVNGRRFRTDQLRVFNNGRTLGLEDIDGGGDNDYNDLMVSCSDGTFTSIHRWQL